MLRSLFIAGIYLAFLVLGAAAPFIFALGYVWVDTFTPQYIAYDTLAKIPVSFIIAIASIVGYILLDRKSPPKLNIIMVLTLLMAVWVTITTIFLAVVPSLAWYDWNYAIKMLLFSVFLQLVFRSRVQIESFIQIYVFSLGVQFLSTGIKTLISGGGYGIDLGVISGNSGLAEGATLATVCIMIVPMLLYLRTHSVLLPRSWLTNIMYLSLVVITIGAAIGTYERTGLIVIIVMAVGLWLRARRKFWGGIIGIVAGVIGFSIVSHGYLTRINTIQDYHKSLSTLGRILVWKWTLGFVGTHPFGGGFGAYRADVITFPAAVTGDHPVTIYGKAFHSTYFAVLGGQGWIGLALLFGLIVSSFWALHTTAQRAKRLPNMTWCRDLAHTVQLSLTILLVGGLVLDLAYQPMMYYLFMLSACLRQHISRVESNLVPGSAPHRQIAGTRRLAISRLSNG